MDKIAVQVLLEVLAGFDEFGGASPGLVAWELFADEPAVIAAWEHALAEGWLSQAGHDLAGGEQLWKLTPRGWVAAGQRPPALNDGRQAAEDG